jgi:hypothetical protein
MPLRYQYQSYPRIGEGFPIHILVVVILDFAFIVLDFKIEIGYCAR